MKKGLAIFAIITFASTFVACKKRYTCTCTYGTYTDSIVLAKQTKSNAKTTCATYESSGVTCSI